MNDDLRQQVEELMSWKKSLEDSHSIPLDIDQSFRARFATSIGISNSSKSSSSENQTVHEGGVAVYDVLKAPDAFVQVQVNGITKYIPIFT